MERSSHHFHPGPGICRHLLFLLGNKQFESYWFETATLTFLITLLKQKQFFLPDLSNVKTGKELLTSFDIENISSVTLFFQASYLTIREVLKGKKSS